MDLTKSTNLIQRYSEIVKEVAVLKKRHDLLAAELPIRLREYNDILERRKNDGGNAEIILKLNVIEATLERTNAELRYMTSLLAERNAELLVLNESGRHLLT
jgi:succinylarginine dihydrolase